MRRSVALAALALCVGCQKVDGGEVSMRAQAISAPPTYVVALDTSTSAKEIHEELYNRAVRHMEEMPRDSRLLVFRFDSAAAEVYDGEAIVDGAEAGMTLKPELTWSSKTSGTNLARLFERINDRIGSDTGSVYIDVYTDCGTEEMSRRDDEKVREITSDWNEAGNVSISFHGVKTGFREKLRALVSFPVAID